MRKAVNWPQLTVMLIILGMSSPFHASSQTPLCDQDATGTVACFERKLCSCGFDRGGSMTGVESGYRWDCGIQRPACDQDSGNATLPAAALPYLPDGIIVDNRRAPKGNFADGYRPKHGKHHRDERPTSRPQPRRF